MQCFGSGIFIPDPNISISYPGSRIHGQEDSGSGTKKIVSKLLEIWSEMFNPDTDRDFLPIPDTGVKKATDHGFRIRNAGMMWQMVSSEI
jgi:hypothetical protein